MSLVHDISLGVFAVATSTCDTYGDGDAVGFPVLRRLAPAIEQLLLAKAATAAFPLPPPEVLAANVTGQYCSADSARALQVRVETLPPPTTTLPFLSSASRKVLVARWPNGSHEYPFVLQYLPGGGQDAGQDGAGRGGGGDGTDAAAAAPRQQLWFRRVMGPEKWLPEWA